MFWRSILLRCRPRSAFQRLAILASLFGAISYFSQSGVRANDREDGAPAQKTVLDSVEKTIGREPKYAGTPRYALLVLGPEGKTIVWMVEDGDVLYVDKNANSDLTDDGPPISQSDVREWNSDDGASRDCDYLLDAITPANGAPAHRIPIAAMEVR